MQKYLSKTGVLTKAIDDDITAEAEALAAATRDAMNETQVLDPLELFDHVYEASRPALLEQREYLKRELASTIPHDPGSES
jgi:pyruvate dehydrogenase E1 component alpha subunit